MNKKYEKIALLVFSLLILIRLYLLFTQPIDVDAATTFYYFTSAGLEQSISYYPAPNNHVLHSVLTTLFYYPGPWQTYLLRIPAFIFGCSSLFLFFGITKKLYGLIPSLIALAFFGVLEPVLYYSCVARGYSMILFFTLAAVGLWLKSNDFRNIFYSAVYALVLGMGIYTIPSHLYFVFAFSLGFGVYSLGKPGFWQAIFRINVYNFLGISLSYFAYKPILRQHGIEGVIANQYTKSKG